MRLTDPLLALLVSIAVVGCKSSEPSPWTARAGRVDDRALAALCSHVWEASLAADPLRATQLGDPRYHGELEPPTLEARDQARARAERFLERARAIAEPAGTEDRITLELLREELEVQIAELSLAVDYDSWNLDLRSGPQNTLLSLSETQPRATDREREQLLERWSRMDEYLDACRANLLRGLARGRVASRNAIERTLAQLDHVLAIAPRDCALVAKGSDATDGDRVLRVVASEVYPALERYRDAIRDNVLPRARDDDRPGVMHVAGGDEAYRVAIRKHTSLDLQARAIHEIGLREVARVREEIATLGETVFGTRDVGEIQRRLRTDAALQFATRDEVEAKAREALAKADAALPRAFTLLPKARCEVARVPEHEERDTTPGYYLEPTVTGERPGRYYINTYAPETRPRYDAEVLAYHEGVPGHHLQIAIAQELESLPPWRRFNGQNAFVEGWALYGERLADELGLYSSDLNRLGMLSFDAWRCSRLVVDTGLHALAWTRDQAIRYLIDHTLLSEQNAIKEVDRYIAWPGQALGYKLGQLEIVALRAQAERELGARFSLAQFHRRVLEHGAVTLAVLRREIERWIDEERAR